MKYAEVQIFGFKVLQYKQRLTHRTFSGKTETFFEFLINKVMGLGG